MDDELVQNASVSGLVTQRCHAACKNKVTMATSSSPSTTTFHGPISLFLKLQLVARMPDALFSHFPNNFFVELLRVWGVLQVVLPF